MAMESILTDALAHLGSGVVVAMLDFVSSRVANPQAARLDRKKECLLSIETLLDSEPSTSQSVESPEEQTAADAPPPANRQLAQDSVEYAEHIRAVRTYLASSGLVKLQLPLLDRVKQGFLSLIRDEKVNGLTNLQKLGVALGIEVLYDTIFGFHYYTAILKHSPVAAIVVNVYQIPAFWAGLWIGKGLRNLSNVLITSRDEKKLDQALAHLLKQTNIVEIVVAYQPPEEVRENLLEQGISLSASQLTRVGQGAFSHLKHLAASAKDAADDVLTSPQQHDAQHEQEREERKKRFDDLTKGR